MLREVNSTAGEARVASEAVLDAADAGLECLTLVLAVNQVVTRMGVRAAIEPAGIQVLAEPRAVTREHALD